ncbi:MAG: hypothetical protein Q8N53_03880 [Longimicrobiales bacterium]|nr:hypothetical protein [Longimicrobiales bacterium]
MRKEGLLTGWERNRWILAVAMGAGLISTALPVIAQQQPVVLERELKMKVKDPFTVAVVGDLNYVHPVAGLADPDVQRALQIIRDADVGFANMESNKWTWPDIAVRSPGSRGRRRSQPTSNSS